MGGGDGGEEMFILKGGLCSIMFALLLSKLWCFEIFYGIRGMKMFNMRVLEENVQKCNVRFFMF